MVEDGIGGIPVYRIVGTVVDRPHILTTRLQVVVIECHYLAGIVINGVCLLCLDSLSHCQECEQRKKNLFIMVLFFVLLVYYYELRSNPFAFGRP